MNENHDLFLIFIVGMGTVFIVLWIVVVLGQLMIRLTNISSMDEKKEEKILKAVVSKITLNKGELISFERINKTK